MTSGGFIPFYNSITSAIASGPQTSHFALVAMKCVHTEWSYLLRVCQYLSVPFKVNPHQSPTWRLF